ncbi:hypothetical protein HII31_07795 [Pseudocercospora fuligena]|uniref:Uncharacterized protein n=1 Tax=Pseudocercospora fuligena TaxID=685502 RepID=A0A8H6RDP4_9PEZI|nr:hypothetical protein HII31_07795 [Pseudocercospora fuligena]
MSQSVFGQPSPYSKKLKQDLEQEKQNREAFARSTHAILLQEIDDSISQAERDLRKIGRGIVSKKSMINSLHVDDLDDPVADTLRKELENLENARTEKGKERDALSRRKADVENYDDWVTERRLAKPDEDIRSQSRIEVIDQEVEQRLKEIEALNVEKVELLRSIEQEI